LSLGARNPLPPNTWRGTIINPAAATAACFMKSLLEACVFLRGNDFFFMFCLDKSTFKLAVLAITYHPKVWLKKQLTVTYHEVKG
jgi:hypothetical protein